jgi:imidazolonepropionase-like amidohydrolase
MILLLHRPPDPMDTRIRSCRLSASFVNFFLVCMLSAIAPAINAQQTDQYILLKPDRVFDGEQMQTNWVVLVRGNVIEQAGEMRFKLPGNTKIVELKGCTLLPGLIEGHSHLFLHPYNETNWDDQVLKESRAERNARAVNHARATLLAGFTTVRDLGTEGAMYDDAGLKQAIEKGIVPGPRMICATRAIVASGSYGVKSGNADVEFPKGAAEVSGTDNMMQEVRTQISKGADLIKVYADYRWGLAAKELPTFSVEEIAAAVSVAKNSGREVVAHAATPEGMRRAAMAGVISIEHGDNGTEAIFKLMKEKSVAYCPTLAATEAYQVYDGWKKGKEEDPTEITAKKNSFRAALKSGVTICMGGDVGVFSHGDNAREMELMVEYGMPATDVLKSATSVNAAIFGYSDRIGKIKKGMLADIIAVTGDPSTDIKAVRKVKLVIKDGIIYKE